APVALLSHFSSAAHPPASLLFSRFLSSPLLSFHDSATTAIYTLSLHDALPIFVAAGDDHVGAGLERGGGIGLRGQDGLRSPMPRSEEHTSELQSRFDLVCRLLLEKKKKTERQEKEERQKEVAARTGERTTNTNK